MATRRGKGEGGSPFKDKQGRWRAFVTVGYSDKGKQIKKWVYGHTRHEVAQKLAKLLPSAGSGLVNPSKITVGEWLERWAKEQASIKNLAPRTVANHAVYRKHITKALGQVRLSNITPVQVRALYAQLADGGLGGEQMQHIHAFLKAGLRDAKRAGLIERNPVEDVDRPPSKKVRPARALRKDQALAVMEALEGTRFHVPITLALTIGVRPGELLALRWNDLEAPFLHIPGTKTENAPRVVQLDEESLAMLGEHKANQAKVRYANRKYWQETGLMFPSTYGTQWTPRNFRRDLDKALDDKGLEPITPHTFRHTYVSHAVPIVGLKEVSERVGHSDPAFTARQYQHLSGEDLARSAVSKKALYGAAKKQEPESDT